MDFDKLISQRAKKAAALNPEAGERMLAAKEKVVAEVQAEKRHAIVLRILKAKKAAGSSKAFTCAQRRPSVCGPTSIACRRTIRRSTPAMLLNKRWQPS